MKRPDFRDRLHRRQHAERRVDEMLDLQAVPPDERWPRISAAIRRLDAQRGRDWRLKLLLPDAADTAAQMPRLVARWDAAGLRFDSAREPGGVQGTVLAPRGAPDTLVAA
jgi:hypothetical protein